jgi:DNA-directed RNA polymerase subunit RPC12/RpoP
MPGEDQHVDQVSTAPARNSPVAYRRGIDLVNYNCPHCGGELEVEGSLAGEVVLCCYCKGKTVVPARPKVAVQPVAVSVQPMAAMDNHPLGIDLRADERPSQVSMLDEERGKLTTIILVSAISNIVLILFHIQLW